MVAYSFKKQFVRPILVGLSSVSLSFDCIPKRQTVRAIGARRHARPGETLQLYTGMRTKQCALIGKAICTEITPITIWIFIDGMAIQLGDDTLTAAEIEFFARQDGFNDATDMANFWRREHKLPRFEGVVISWRALS